MNSNFCNVCHNYPFLSYKSSLTTALICLPCRVVSVLGTTYIPTSSSSSASLPDNDRSELVTKTAGRVQAWRMSRNLKKVMQSPTCHATDRKWSLQRLQRVSRRVRQGQSKLKFTFCFSKIANLWPLNTAYAKKSISYYTLDSSYLVIYSGALQRPEGPLSGAP